MLISPRHPAISMCLADLSSKVCQGGYSPKGYARFLRITMALLSQALHLGYLLSPHSAFQGHAAHTARWPAMLSPNGSSDTCISDGVFHIPMPCFHGALPVYPQVLPHSSRLLHGAARAPTTLPHPTLREGVGVSLGSPFPTSRSACHPSRRLPCSPW